MAKRKTVSSTPALPPPQPTEPMQKMNASAIGDFNPAVNAVLAANGIAGASPLESYRANKNPTYPTEVDFIDIIRGFSLTEAPLSFVNCTGAELELVVNGTARVARPATWQAVNRAIFAFTADDYRAAQLRVHITGVIDAAKNASALLLYRDIADNTALPVVSFNDAASVTPTAIFHNEGGANMRVDYTLGEELATSTVTLLLTRSYGGTGYLFDARPSGVFSDVMPWCLATNRPASVRMYVEGVEATGATNLLDTYGAGVKVAVLMEFNQSIPAAQVCRIFANANNSEGLSGYNRLAQWRHYSGTFTAAEKAAFKVAGTTGNLPYPSDSSRVKLLYAFDTVITSATTSVPDVSGRGRNGTPYGFPASF